MAIEHAEAGYPRAKKKVRHGKLDIFSTHWRLGRIRYIGYTFGFAVLAAVLSFISSKLVLALPAAIAGYFIGFSAIVIYGGLLLITIMLTIKRSHDFDTSGWLSLLLLIPLGMLVFWLIPGTDSVNRFGRDLPPNSFWEKLLAAVAVITLFSASGFLIKTMAL